MMESSNMLPKDGGHLIAQNADPVEKTPDRLEFRNAWHGNRAAVHSIKLCDC